jgi:hypothetical protein
VHGYIQLADIGLLFCSMAQFSITACSAVHPAFPKELFDFDSPYRE